jgi:hypothetical protein
MRPRANRLLIGLGRTPVSAIPAHEAVGDALELLRRRVLAATFSSVSGAAAMEFLSFGWGHRGRPAAVFALYGFD